MMSTIIFIRRRIWMNTRHLLLCGWTFHLNSLCVLWWIKLNRHSHFFRPGFSLHTPPCSTLGGKQSESSMLKHHLHHLLSHYFLHNISYSCLFKPLHLAEGWILVGDIVSEWWAVLSIPESVQSPLWILQSSREQRSSWVSWVIVAQVQLSQMGRVGAQSWSQRSTAFLCDQAARQPTHTHTHTFIYSISMRIFLTEVNRLIKY